MKRKLHSTARAFETVAGLPLFDWADQQEAEAKRLEVEKQKRTDGDEAHPQSRGGQSLKARTARFARSARQALADLIRPPSI
jgi:hypothetical protein